jgi:hypothetical protein
MEVFLNLTWKDLFMKKSLLLTLALVAACGYVIAEDATTPAPKTPTTEDETTQAQPAQEDETLDMDDATLDETEEAK